MTDREKAGLRGPVRTVRAETWFSGQAEACTDERAFLEDGRLERRLYANSDGVGGLQEYRYDAQGLLITETWSSDHRVEVIRHEYDEAGRRIRTLSLGSDGIEKVTEEWQYQADGTAVQTRRFTPLPGAANSVSFDVPIAEGSQLSVPVPGASRAETHFDAAGFAKDTVFFGTRGEQLSRVLYRRDTEGRLLNEWMESAYSSVQQRVMYVYDEDGRRVEMFRDLGQLGSELVQTRYDEFGNPVAIEIDRTNGGHRFLRSEYVYDNQGNWIEQVQRLSLERGTPEEPHCTVRRSITYFG